MLPRAASTLAPFVLLALLFTPVVACDDATDPGDDSVAEAVLPGKADNYLSPTSREYRVWGLGELALDADTWRDRDAADREAHVVEMLGHRLKAYTHFVNVYVADKSHGASNADYGGFGGLVRGTSLDFIYEPMDDDGLLWAFIWEIEIGGPQDLLDRLPLQTATDGSKVMMLPVPVLTESQLVRGSYPRDFDPATYTGDVEEVEVVFDAVEASVDGWPEYDRLFDDGLLEILIIVGGDYNDKRYDLLSAESHFKWLKSAGYTHPAAAWTDLTLDSPPFVGSLDANGRDVRVEITLLHPDIVPDADLDRLRDRIIAGYGQADVVIYDGHAGEDPDYSGVVYHYNPRHAISVTALGQLDLPEKYQIYMFNGCKTYGAYPEGVMKNPVKTPENLDIVSTVSFSWLSQQTFTTSGFIRELLALSGRTHAPRTWRQVLTRINQHANANVYYGVHGIDDNPHINPYADVATLCQTCSRDADCPGVGNMCVGFGDGTRRCAAECTADDGCPSSYVCGDIAVSGRITGQQCLPATYRCE